MAGQPVSEPVVAALRPRKRLPTARRCAVVCDVQRGLGHANGLVRLTSRIHAFAFSIRTLAILCGAIWAESAYGRYWGWDRKRPGHSSPGSPTPATDTPTPRPASNAPWRTVVAGKRRDSPADPPAGGPGPSPGPGAGCAASKVTLAAYSRGLGRGPAPSTPPSIVAKVEPLPGERWPAAGLRMPRHRPSRRASAARGTRAAVRYLARPVPGQPGRPNRNAAPVAGRGV